MKIFITGGAGYVGAMLLEAFSKREDVSLILAIDLEPLPDFIKDKKKIRFMQKNLGDNSWVPEARAFQPDLVIHAAWQIREMYGKKAEQWKRNIIGSLNVFDFSFSTPSVKKLIFFSTVASYGAFKGNATDVFFNEEDLFRKSDYSYAEEKRISEEHLKERYDKSRVNGSKVQVVIIRPVAITGPCGRTMRIRFGLQSALSGKLKGSVLYRIINAMVAFVPITKNWCRQFVHEDDIVNIVELLSFANLKKDYDIFNICPPGPVVRGEDMGKVVGKKIIYVYPWIIRIVFFIAWHLTRGKIPTSQGVSKSYSYPIAVDGSKIKKVYGYDYLLSSKDALTSKKGRYCAKVN